MRWLYALQVLACLAGQASAQRPRYDPIVERQFGRLLDSLVLIMGDAPASIVVQRLPYYRGLTIRTDIKLDITSNDPDDEDALLHELGHAWSFQRARITVEIADSLRFDPFSRAGSERLANLYADILRVRTGRIASARPDVAVLMRLIGAR